MIDTNNWILSSKEERSKHVDLTEKCLERGGTSPNHKGVLAQYLDTTIPSGKILLCHACHNAKCSNPKHLYWGTYKENFDDAVKNGTQKSIWQKRVEKNGYEKTMQQMHEAASLGGRANRNKPKTEEHRKKISESLSQ